MFTSEEGLQYFLFYSILIFIGAALLFLILLLISRLYKIQQKKTIARYTLTIDRLLFDILFSDTRLHQIIDSKTYERVLADKTFNKILLKNILKLHESYSGDYGVKLEEFYRKSGLINISFSKVSSNSWSNKCEGIRELSLMNVKEAFSVIHSCIKHNNSTLTLEALLGIIRLEGPEGLSVLIDYTEPINDWIQLNVLYEINNKNIVAVKSFSRFLTSKNDSVVLLGLRLIAKFEQEENIGLISELEASHPSVRIKNEAEKTRAGFLASGINN